MGAKEKWLDRFGKSIQKWNAFSDDIKDSNDPDHFLSSIDARISNYFPEETDDDELLKIGLHAMLFQKVDSAFNEIEQSFIACESKIEMPILLALVIVAREFGWGVVLKTKNAIDGDREERNLENLCIEPQATLGNYRVDFLLTLSIFGPDFSQVVKFKTGIEIPGSKTVSKSMIIECDGHDFHERTKEQARLDRSRDRSLQSLGYLVFRFTGSEIWSDVFKHAHDALRSLYRATDEGFSVK